MRGEKLRERLRSSLSCSFSSSFIFITRRSYLGLEMPNKLRTYLVLNYICFGLWGSGHLLAHFSPKANSPIHLLTSTRKARSNSSLKVRTRSLCSDTGRRHPSRAFAVAQAWFGGLLTLTSAAQGNFRKHDGTRCNTMEHDGTRWNTSPNSVD